jgi:hypothetical protein
MAGRSAIVVIAMGLAAAVLVQRPDSRGANQDDNRRLQVASVDAAPASLAQYPSTGDSTRPPISSTAQQEGPDLATLTRQKDSLQGEFQTATARLQAGTLDMNSWLNDMARIDGELSQLIDQLDRSVHLDRDAVVALRTETLQLLGQMHYDRNRFSRSLATAGKPSSPSPSVSSAAPASSLAPVQPRAASPTPSTPDQAVVLQQLMRPQQPVALGQHIALMPATEAVTCYKTELRYEPGPMRHQLMRVPTIGFNPFGLRDLTWVPNQQYVMRPVITPVPCNTGQCPLP